MLHFCTIFYSSLSFNELVPVSWTSIACILSMVSLTISTGMVMLQIWQGLLERSWDFCLERANIFQQLIWQHYTKLIYHRGWSISCLGCCSSNNILITWLIAEKDYSCDRWSSYLLLFYRYFHRAKLWHPDLIISLYKECLFLSNIEDPLVITHILNRTAPS